MLDEKLITARELSSTAELYGLFVMPEAQRGSLWRTSLDKAFWNSAVSVPAANADRTVFYNGFPYLRINLPSPGANFQAHRVSDLVQTAAKFGLGIAVYLTSDDPLTQVNHIEPLSRVFSRCPRFRQKPRGQGDIRSLPGRGDKPPFIPQSGRR